MHEHQEQAVKYLFKEYIAKGTLKPDALVSVRNEKNKEIEKIPINVLFDL
jgi:hypothetical protein